MLQKYRRTSLYTSQQAHHGQMTSKQRCINVDSVGTTLFRRRLTMMCPLGCYKNNFILITEKLVTAFIRISDQHILAPLSSKRLGKCKS